MCYFPRAKSRKKLRHGFFLDTLAERLLAAAEKYQLDQLKDVCVKHLCSKIGVKNCLNYLVFGDTYYAEKLKNSSLHLIERHKARIFKSNNNNWKEILQEHPNLMAEVIERLAVQGEDVNENITQRVVVFSQSSPKKKK